VKAAQKLRAVCGIVRLIESHLVFLLHLVAGMGEGEGQISVVGHDQEAFTLLVESPDVENTGPFLREKVVNCRTPTLVIGCAHHTLWFVHHRMDGVLCLHDTAADFYRVLRADHRGEFCHDPAVDFYPAFFDELLHASTRAKPGASKKTV
jgi:hypothetical protein